MPEGPGRSRSSARTCSRATQKGVGRPPAAPPAGAPPLALDQITSPPVEVEYPCRPTPRDPMLRLEDCLARCGLSEEEVLAIAEHEHLPEITAAELGNYLVHTADGERCIKAMIRDDIDAAIARSDRTHAL